MEPGHILKAQQTGPVDAWLQSKRDREEPYVAPRFWPVGRLLEAFVELGTSEGETMRGEGWK